MNPYQLKFRSIHTRRLEPTTTYISPSPMLRGSDGDIGGGKFVRSGSYALSFYFSALDPILYYDLTTFSFIALSDLRLGNVPRKEPHHGTFRRRWDSVRISPPVVTILPERSVVELSLGVA